MPMNLPPQIQQEAEEYKERQRYNPDEVERVEGNLRMTKIRRTIPITSHYYSNFNGREQPNR